jgi:hypothetical protein
MALLGGSVLTSCACGQQQMLQHHIHTYPSVHQSHGLRMACVHGMAHRLLHVRMARVRILFATVRLMQ